MKSENFDIYLNLPNFTCVERPKQLMTMDEYVEFVHFCLENFDQDAVNERRTIHSEQVIPFKI